MEVEWYLKLSDKEVGPLSAVQLKRMADRGQITPGDPVRRGSDGRWVPAGNVKGLLPAGGSSPVGTPSGPAPEAKQPDTPLAYPQAQPISQPEPGGVPIAQPAGSASGHVSVAQPVGPAPRTPAPSPRSSGGVRIDAGDDTLVSRYAGRRSGTAAPPTRKRRRNDLIIVALAVTLVALIAVGAGLMLSGRKTGDATEKTQAEAGEAVVDGQDKREPVVIPGLADYLGEPSPEGPEQAKPAPPGADEWTDASASSAACGDVTVKIAAAEVGHPRLIRRSTGRAARPKTDYLSLNIELFNQDKTKKLEYTSWNAVQTGVKLVDDHNNEYAMKSFASQGLEIDGQVEGGKGSLYPEEVTRDVLVFEKPAKSAERLRLELPASAFGENGSLKFEIPASMIAVVEEPEEEPSAGEGAELAGGQQGEVAPGREVPAISRAIGEVETAGGPAMGGAPPAAQDDAATEQAADAPIAIPGVTGEGSQKEEEGASFADDPKLQKAYEELRRQKKEAAEEEQRGRRNRKK